MSESSDRGLRWSVFVPLLVIVLALLVQSLYQSSQLRTERETLETQYEQQKQPLEESKKLRTQLESLAGATATLAEQGNKNAIKLREHLQKQGITIRPPTPKS